MNDYVRLQQVGYKYQKSLIQITTSIKKPEVPPPLRKDDTIKKINKAAKLK